MRDIDREENRAPYALEHDDPPHEPIDAYLLIGLVIMSASIFAAGAIAFVLYLGVTL